MAQSWFEAIKAIYPPLGSWIIHEQNGDENRKAVRVVVNLVRIVGRLNTQPCDQAARKKPVPEPKLLFTTELADAKSQSGKRDEAV